MGEINKSYFDVRQEDPRFEERGTAETGRHGDVSGTRPIGEARTSITVVCHLPPCTAALPPSSTSTVSPPRSLPLLRHSLFVYL
ncbi:hypothetical protein Hanom_Chr04g00322561 [Helianthus anomalus]